MSDRFPFIVDRSGDQATIAMRVGDVIRAREMPVSILQSLTKTVRAMQDEPLQLTPDEIPVMPRFRPQAKAIVEDVCAVTMGFSRLESGEIERTIAIYDIEDNTAPVLVLVEEQIAEFLHA